MKVLQSNRKDVLMVSTDLDGTLLDHHSYSWQAASPALALLKSKHIPVILNTSKTMSEVVALQKQLTLSAPFVVENGSALFLPKVLFPSAPEATEDGGEYWIKMFGVSRTLIVNQLQKLREQYGWRFEGFSDWTPQQVIEHTGLSALGAEQALGRAFSEPILWQDTHAHFEHFSRLIELFNFSVLQGGRFTHILGKTDKGMPLSWLSQFYRQQKMGDIKWIVLGDSQNDIDMLTLAHYPVAVKSPVRDYPQFSSKHSTIFTAQTGPEGWNTAIHNILQQD